MEMDFSLTEKKRNEQPSQIKLELKTPLERLFMWLSICSALVLFVGVVGYLEDGMGPLPISTMSVGLVGLVFFFNLYYNTDNFYVLDLERKQLLYHFKFFFIKKISVAESFSDICAVSVSAKYHKSKHSQWYTYQVVYVNNDGNVYPLSDSEREAIQKQRDLAQKIASFTESEYVENPPECYATEVRKGSGYSFGHQKCSWLDSLKETLFAIVCVFAFIVFIVSINIYNKQIVEIIRNIFK